MPKRYVRQCLAGEVPDFPIPLAADLLGRGIPHQPRQEGDGSARRKWQPIANHRAGLNPQSPDSIWSASKYENFYALTAPTSGAASAAPAIFLAALLSLVVLYPVPIDRLCSTGLRRGPLVGPIQRHQRSMMLVPIFRARCTVVFLLSRYAVTVWPGGLDQTFWTYSDRAIVSYLPETCSSRLALQPDAPFRERRVVFELLIWEGRAVSSQRYLQGCMQIRCRTREAL